jgi:hypothetical protein
MPIDDTKFFGLTTRTVTRALSFAVDAGADQLHENIAFGERSGEHWAGLPHQSSAPGEFPQEQFGDLRDSVKSWRLNALRFAMGFQNAPFYAADIEVSRAPLAHTFEDPLTHEVMMTAIVGGV